MFSLACIIQRSSESVLILALLIPALLLLHQVPQEVPTHAYDVSKAAVHQLTHKFAADFAPKFITVNCLAPGYVPSRMSQGLKAWGADEETMANGIPLQRMGRDTDMVGACIYLSSIAGSWCTGLILNVDGGTVGARSIPVSSL